MSLIKLCLNMIVVKRNVKHLIIEGILCSYSIGTGEKWEGAICLLSLQ
jgi:hypothetical protein